MSNELIAAPGPRARRGVRVSPRPFPAATGRLMRLLVAYLGCVGVLFGVTATQATWGGPPWWPVAVGAALVTALCALGFAAGVVFPHWLTAPLAAIGALLLMLIGMHYAVGATGGVALLSPVSGVPPFDVGLFYPYVPDLAIDQVMFLAGVALAAVGLFGLAGVAGARAVSASAGRGLRLATVAVTAAGLAASGTAAGLASTARLGAHGVIIPALHDAASDRPIDYTPVCAGTAVPVCLHPAYQSYLPSISAALSPALAAVAGLPGAPVRAVQVATTFQMSAGSLQYTLISGSPPVLRLYLANVPPPVLNAAGGDGAPLRLIVVHTFVGAGAGPGTLAQQAVQAALLQAAGVPLASQPAVVYQAPWSGPRLVPVRGSAMYAAAGRFAALPAAARRAWLTAHLPALRAGQLTLADLP